GERCISLVFWHDCTDNTRRPPRGSIGNRLGELPSPEVPLSSWDFNPMGSQRERRGVGSRRAGRPVMISKGEIYWLRVVRLAAAIGSAGGSWCARRLPNA